MGAAGRSTLGNAHLLPIVHRILERGVDRVLDDVLDILHAEVDVVRELGLRTAAVTARGRALAGVKTAGTKSGRDDGAEIGWVGCAQGAAGAC